MLKLTHTTLEEAKRKSLTTHTIVQRKYDGTRIIFKEGRLLSERDIDRASRFKQIAEALKGFNGILDGEVCILPNGTVFDVSSKKNWNKAVYVVFDMIEFDGKNMRDLPLSERKELLELHLPRSPFLQLPQGFKSVEEGWKAVIDNNWEGLVLKEPTSQYGNAGLLDRDRQKCWLKLKRVFEAKEEIVGYDDGSVKGAFILANGSRISALSASIVRDYKQMRARGRVFADFNYLMKTKDGNYFQPVLTRLKEEGYEEEKKVEAAQDLPLLC